jgi:hypothetical protein
VSLSKGEFTEALRFISHQRSSTGEKRNNAKFNQQPHSNVLFVEKEVKPKIKLGVPH